jgi:hypothetical protein
VPDKTDRTGDGGNTIAAGGSSCKFAAVASADTDVDDAATSVDDGGSTEIRREVRTACE